MKWIITIFLFLYTMNTDAAWLSVCEDNDLLPPQSHLKKTYAFPETGQKFLLVTEQPLPQCHSIELKNIDYQALVWTELISQPVAKQINHTIILQGLSKQDGQPSISEIIPIPEAKPLAYQGKYLPLNIELIDKLKVSYFGKEERVSHTRTKDLKINCNAGSLPAGAILTIGDQVLPKYPTLVQQIKYKSNANFKMGVSDTSRFLRGEPSILGELGTRFTPQIKNYALSSVNLNKNDPLHWTIVCPKQQAQLNLQSFRLTSDVKQNIAGRSFWSWNAKTWKNRADQLLNDMYELGVETVFISIPISHASFQITHQDKLREFLEKAKAKNISVWVVEGDPHVIFPKERDVFVKRASAINAFNLTLDKSIRLAGIQYDIEPYLIAGFSLSTSMWYEMYITTIQALDNALQMPLEVVVPFWWHNVRVNDDFLIDLVAPYIDGLTVMNYRTDRAMIERFANPFLVWGSEHQIPIRIALEAGKLPDETQWRYHKKPAGELWRLKVAEFDILLLLEKAHQNPTGDAFLFASQRQVSSSQVTFYHDKKALFEMLPDLEEAWRIWPAFQGIALHGVDTM